jgi:hypothetical protein
VVERALSIGRGRAALSSRPVARACLALLCVGLVFVLAGARAGAVEPHPHIGRLPGFPRIRGAIPVLGSPAAISAHERLVNGAFDVARARAEHRSVEPGEVPLRAGHRSVEPGEVPLRAGHRSVEPGEVPLRAERRSVEPNEVAPSGCEEPFFFYSQDVCYQGGPVLRDPTVHLIFWQGPLTGLGQPVDSGVKLFPAGYEETVERYFADVAHDSGLETNVFAVDPQYGDEAGPGKYSPGIYASLFAPADVAVSENPFPSHSAGECTDKTAYSKGPCLLDEDIQKEVREVAAEPARKWPAETLSSVFFVFTPPGVGSCESEGCAYEQYCAYHSDFGGEGVYPPGDQTIYANMPFVGEVAGCDSGVHPNTPAKVDNGADAVIDDASHEFNESITDPLGSQCRSTVPEHEECEPFSWTDAIGQEIADKCLPPESTIAGTYGEPLGEVELDAPLTSYNQVIDGEHYWTQRVWSNAAGESQGACVQRMVHTEFTPPAGASATVPATFDGSSSGSAGDPIAYWQWSFGDGIVVGTPEAEVSHTYATPGKYEVTLTAFDIYGNSNTYALPVEVGAAPVPPPPPAVPAPAVDTVTVTTTVTVPAPVDSATMPKCPSSSPRASKGCPATRRRAATRTPRRRCGSRATSRHGRRCLRSGKRSSGRSRR